MNLTANIAGITFPTCIMNAAGARCVTADELESIGCSRAGAIVTKSMTRHARNGNPTPRYAAFPHGSINAMGLPNLGYQAYINLIPHLNASGNLLSPALQVLAKPSFLTLPRQSTLSIPI